LCFAQNTGSKPPIAGWRICDRKLFAANFFVTGATLKKIRIAASAGMVLLAAAAFVDFQIRDSSRMMMTFYTVADGNDLIEERIVKNTGDRGVNTQVRLYVNETLLGPLSYEAAGFFPIAMVQSCMVNGKTAYIGLPSQVALAGVKDDEDRLTVDTVRSFDTLKKDIGRNFRSLQNIVLFIDGRETADGRETVIVGEETGP
jgi:hypothetical protein